MLSSRVSGSAGFSADVNHVMKRHSYGNHLLDSNGSAVSARFSDDMEMEFGPGIVDRLKSKFASATSGHHHEAAAAYLSKAATSSAPISSPASVAAASVTMRNLTQKSVNGKLDAILSSDVLSNKVVVVDRTSNGQFHSHSASTSHQMRNGTSSSAQPVKSAFLTHHSAKAECVEGLVSQCKAMFDKEAAPPRRKRSKDPLNPSPPPVGSSPTKIPSPDKNVPRNLFRKSDDYTAEVHIDTSPLPGLSFLHSLPNHSINSTPVANIKPRNDKPELPIDTIKSVPDVKAITRLSSSSPLVVPMTSSNVNISSRKTDVVPTTPIPSLADNTPVVSSPQAPPRPARKAYLQLTGNTSSAKQLSAVQTRNTNESVPAATADSLVSKPETKDCKRNRADSMQDSPELKRNEVAAKSVEKSKSEEMPSKASRPEKVQKMNDRESAESEKENSPRRVTLKKVAGYGMTTIIDTRSKPIQHAAPALKIEDPSLLTSLKDLGRTSPLQPLNAGSDVPDGHSALVSEVINLIVIGHNEPTGSKSSLKSPQSRNGSRSNLRISFDDRATTTYEYPSERSFSAEILVLHQEDLNEDVDAIETDTDNQNVSSSAQREGDVLKGRPGKFNGLAGLRSQKTEFQLGMERPKFGEDSALRDVSLTSNDPPQSKVQRREQWCIQPSSNEEERFSNTADELLF